MLADQFAEFQKDPTFFMLSAGMREGVQVLGDGVKIAHRFSLDRKATMMIQNLSTMSYGQFAAALPMCRLPFPLMWVEFAFHDRTEWLREAIAHGMPISYNPEASEPKRLGFLLNEMQRGDNRFIMAHPAWTHLPPTVEVARKAVLFDLSPEMMAKERYEQSRQDIRADPKERAEYKSEQEIDEFAEMNARVTYMTPTYMERLWTEYRRAGETEHATMLAEYDLAAEWKFVLALIITLNSRNLMEYGEVETFSKLNKARAKRGDLPLLSHQPIRIALSKVQRHRMASGYVDRRAPQEAHWVMGHFKRKPSGLYWWSHHVRGGKGVDKAPLKEHKVAG